MTSDDDDGEDKMEKGARREGKTAWDVAEQYIAIAEHEAYEVLKLVRPDHLVRATDYIQQQIDFARGLDEKGFLYKIDGDGMYFDTSRLPDYGKLAGSVLVVGPPGSGRSTALRVLARAVAGCDAGPGGADIGPDGDPGKTGPLVVDDLDRAGPEVLAEAERALGRGRREIGRAHV